MRAYADSSLILRLVTGEFGAQRAVAEYRRLGRPSLFYLPLHALEVENGIRVVQEDVRIQDEDFLTGWRDQMRPPGLPAPYHQAVALARLGFGFGRGRSSPAPDIHR